MSEQTKGHKNLIESVIDTQLDERAVSDQTKKSTAYALNKIRSGDKKKKENQRREKSYAAHEKRTAEKKASERAGRRADAVSARNQSRKSGFRMLRTIARGARSRLKNAKNNPKYVSSEYEPLLNHIEDLITMENTLQQRRKQVFGDNTIIKHYDRQLDNIYSQMEDVIDNYDFDAMLDESNLDEEGKKGKYSPDPASGQLRSSRKKGKYRPDDYRSEDPTLRHRKKGKYNPSEDLDFDAFLATLSEEEIEYLDELPEEEFTEFFNKLKESTE